MRVAAIVFLILIPLTFPKFKALFQIIRNQYVDTSIKRLQKFEKVMILIPSTVFFGKSKICFK